jgi:hypothetical protein
MTKQTIVPPDPKARKRVAIFLVAFAVLGGAGVVWVNAELEELMLCEDGEVMQSRFLEIIMWVRLVAGFITGLLAGLFIKYAVLTKRAGYFPPPGVPVVVPTPLREGRAAMRFAWGLMATALFILLTNVPLWYVQRLVVQACAGV